jgi:hypothetical protein
MCYLNTFIFSLLCSITEMMITYWWDKYDDPLGPVRFLCERKAKHDSTVVTVRQYDGDNTTVRWRRTTTRW